MLNADYSFLNIVHWKRAMCLVVKGKVQVLKESERIIRGAEGLITKVPAVLKLIKVIRTLYKNRIPFSKKNVLVRDGFKCGYYQDKGGVGHIIQHPAFFFFRQFHFFGLVNLIKYSFLANPL